MDNKTKLKGEITIPPDKSISHRSIIFGALTKGKIKIKNLSVCEDVISTLNIFKQLGLKFEYTSQRNLNIDATELFKNKNEEYTFDCGNSGTTTRLLSGLFSWQDFTSVLTGDESLSKRPMKRIIEPLRLMGAEIDSNDYKLPLKIKGRELNTIEYHSPIASAQVKSCILLAGLGIDDITTVYEKNLSRNHTELMLEYLDANVSTGKDNNGYFSQIKKSQLMPKDIEITGDISSAAFFMVAAAIIPNSSVVIKNVGINPTRTGILDVFNQAKIDYRIFNKKTVCSETTADIEVNYTENIKPFEIKGDLVPRLIDEIPILSLLATQADGISIIKDAKDLRNKESDRIKTIVNAYKKLNIEAKEYDDGFLIEGKSEINKDVALETYLDHRLAMTYHVLSLLNKKETKINGFECVNTSFPEFLDLMNKLIVK